MPKQSAQQHRSEPPQHQLLTTGQASMRCLDLMMALSAGKQGQKVLSDDMELWYSMRKVALQRAWTCSQSGLAKCMPSPVGGVRTHAVRPLQQVPGLHAWLMTQD